MSQDPRFDQTRAVRLLPRDRPDFLKHLQATRSPDNRDPNAPRVPQDIVTYHDFMLGDDGDGLPLPFNPIKRFGLDK